MLDAKLLKTSVFNVNGDSIPGPLLIGTFEKRAPGLPTQLVKALRLFHRAQGSNPAKHEFFFRPPVCNCISCFFNCGDLFCIHFFNPQLQHYKIHILIISMYKLLLKEFLRGPLGFMQGSLFDLVLHVYAS